MSEFTWSDASALYQLGHGDQAAGQTDSALSYLKMRLAGCNRDEAAECELIRQQEGER